MSADVIYTIAYVNEDATAIYCWCIVTLGSIFSFKSVACYGQHVTQNITAIRAAQHYFDFVQFWLKMPYVKVSNMNTSV